MTTAAMAPPGLSTTDRTPRQGQPGAAQRRPPFSSRHHLGLVAGVATLLATAPLLPLLDGWRWLFQATVAVAAVTAVAIAARALRAPVWLQPFAMLFGLLVALTWLHPSGHELLGFLPSPASLAHFGELAGQLPADIRTHAIPAPGRPSFLLVVTAGVGVMAILVDLCAVGLRRPALAGLPMLVIYSVPVAIMSTNVPAYTFVVGVVGYLWLLLADNLDKVRRFGRRFTSDGRDVAAWEPSPLAAAGRRLAAIGLVVAVALPLAIPGVSSGLVDRFSSGFAGLTGTGSGPGTVSVNLFAQLDGLLNRDEVVDMFDVTTSDPDPHYLKIGTADQMTADGFDHRPARGSSLALTNFGDYRPNPPGVAWHTHRTEVGVLPGFVMPRLPTYPLLTAVDGTSGPWRYDPDQQVLFAASGERSTGQEYVFVSARPEFDPDALRQVGPVPDDHPLAELARIPDPLREPWVTQEVARITEGLDNLYDQVLAILAYFSVSNGFRYSLETGNATTGSAIVDFLRENQQGYCVQYAAAMTWMVRELGLPARVAIGFTSGGNRADGSFRLTNHNAHAWPEVYFEGFGWVPFEPTPSSSVPGSVARDWAPDPNATGDPESPEETEPTLPEFPEVPEELQDEFLPDDPAGTPLGPPGEGRNWLAVWLAAGLALLLALLAAPALTRSWLRRLRLRRHPRSPALEPVPGRVTVTADASSALRQRAHAAWDELLDSLIDFRLPVDEAETPRHTAARLAGLPGVGGPAQHGSRLLGQAEELARYAREPLPADGLAGALQAVRRALGRRASAATRLRAVLLPPSTVLRWRRTVGDAVTSVAIAVNRTTERLSPRRLLARPR